MKLTGTRTKCFAINIALKHLFFSQYSARILLHVSFFKNETKMLIAQRKGKSPASEGTLSFCFVFLNCRFSLSCPNSMSTLDASRQLVPRQTAVELGTTI